MKKVVLQKVFLSLGIICINLTQTTHAIDLPSFYRAPGFQLSSQSKMQNWATMIAVQGRSGETKKAYNGQEKSTGLFNTEGPFNIGQIVPYDPSVAGGASNSTNPVPTAATLAFVDAVYAIAPGGQRIPKNGAPFSFNGTFSETDFVFELQQNIMLGFYGGIHVPIRTLQINDISYSTTIPTTDAKYAPLVAVIENQLDPMLAQNNISPIKTPFNETGLGDIAVFAGWQGRNETASDFIDYICGGVRLAVTFPSGSEKDIDSVFSLPFGYNGHYGMSARGNVEFGFFKKLAFGGTAGTSIFLRQTLPRRVKTDLTQNGWILLNKANVFEDHGHLWDVCGYLKGYLKYGTIILGYSFCQQEQTRITIAARDNQDALFKNEIINTDGRLSGWNYQTIHALVRVDLAPMTNLFCAPMLELSYDCPWAGKHAFQTDMVGGKIGLVFTWDF